MGRLIIVGTGVKSLSHITEEAKFVIRSSEHCLYLITEKNLEDWIVTESKSSESLERFFCLSERRVDIYKNISKYIVETADKYETLCVVFYGHPVFFARSALSAALEHKKKKRETIVLPAISSVDNLWSDLCVDPGDEGCSIYEATDFLISRRVFDTRSHLVLLQVGVIGVDDLKLKNNLNILQEYLEEFYPARHQIILYEASTLPGRKSLKKALKLSDLRKENVSRISTLYIPPQKKRNHDEFMIKKIKLNNL